MPHVLCANCGRNLTYQDAQSGKRVKCPQCGRPFVLPAQSMNSTLASDTPVSGASSPSKSSGQNRLLLVAGAIAAAAVVATTIVIIVILSRGDPTANVQNDPPKEPRPAMDPRDDEFANAIKSGMTDIYGQWQGPAGSLDIFWANDADNNPEVREWEGAIIGNLNLRSSLGDGPIVDWHLSPEGMIRRSRTDGDKPTTYMTSFSAMESAALVRAANAQPGEAPSNITSWGLHAEIFLTSKDRMVLCLYGGKAESFREVLVFNKSR